uniref:Prokineticin domain-containing protein n=1 Tax=Amblyomma maculatum TaxID=34609 RepID=G3MTF9_AMBMU
MVIVAAAFITVIHHANGNDAESTERNAPDYPPWLTRHPVGTPCDSWANCERHLCCARMTERNGNKCYERNSTIGARCSTNRWPRGSKILSFIGGCPCAKGLRCKMNQKLGYGTCEYRINTQRKV